MRKGRYVNKINLSGHDHSYLSLQELQLLLSWLLLYFILRCQQQDKEDKKREYYLRYSERPH